MPYNATGTYTPPAGATTASPGDIIRSATWNAIFNDISTALTAVGNQVYGETIITTTPYAPLATDAYIAMNVTSASVINLPLTATRGNYPITIKDITGKAQQYPITINANGSETIEKQASITIFVPYGGVTLRPVSGGWAVVAAPRDNLTTLMSGTGTASVPSSILRATDNVVVTPSNTDQFGNFTPEGWYNVCTQQYDWYGAGSLSTGTRAALLANVFLSTPSAAGNASNFYSPLIATCNIYTDDNGIAGTPKGHAFGLATVSYLKSTVKHWNAIFGYEADVTVEAGASVDLKIGIASFATNNDAVQGNIVDAAFYATALNASPGWKVAYLVNNQDGTNPLSGTVLATKGAIAAISGIDFSSATFSGFLFNSGPLQITGQGAYKVVTGVLTSDVPALALYSGNAAQHTYAVIGRVAGTQQDLIFGAAGSANDFMPGTIAGDAIISYSGTIYFGHLASAPHMVISGNGFGYAAGTGGTVTQATSKATGVTLNKTSGQITLNNAALAAATIVSFVLTDSAIAATDVLILNHISGGTSGAYSLNAQAAAGSATINVRNNTAGSLSEAIVIQFAIIKAVNA